MKDVYTDLFLEARRKVIADHFSLLNNMQKQAVLATEGPLLVLAGAGSGKTTVLISRIANLIRFGCGADSNQIPEEMSDEDARILINYVENKNPDLKEKAEQLCRCEPVMPWNIIAITFTNKAANEIKARLTAMLGEQADGVWAMTFHSACCRILRKNIELLGYNSDFTIYDSADSERVMKLVVKEMGLDEKTFSAKSVLNAISEAKDQLLTPEELLRISKSSNDYRALRIAQAYGEYQQRLRIANAVDFDDIILLTVRLLQQYDTVKEYYQQKFRYVMIDEYQDTNNLQYLLATLLSGRYENICVVGDDDQSIYKFRGATIENILSFETHFHSARVIRLEQNYRSSGYILEAANAVIANNKGRKGKTLWTENDLGEKIVLHCSDNEISEGNFIAGEILSGKSRNRRYGDYAVLYRTNAQSNAIEMAFKRNGIPYRIIGGTRFFDRTEIKDMLAYLQVVNNTTDDLRLRRIINVPARGIGTKTLEAIERQANAAGLSMFSVIENAESYPSLEKVKFKLKSFADKINMLRYESLTVPLDKFYDLAVESSGYLKALEEKNLVENETRIDNVRELKSSIITYISGSEEPSLRGFLEEVSLYTDIEKYDQDADAAVMMTIHSAKGLEFPCVFVAGMEDGLFPGTRVMMDPAELEEERRLCYVAMTRAKSQLYLSWTKQRMIFGRTNFNRKSRFIAEIPSDSVKEDTYPSGRDITVPENMKTIRKATPYQSRGGGTSPQNKINKRAESLELKKGDTIVHTAFGVGLVLDVMPVGGDALLEIAFDSIGTKRLMQNTAAAHIRKK